MTIRTALAVVSALAGAAHADVVVASHTDTGLTIQQVSADRIATVYREQATGAYRFAFADASTLWALRKTGGGFTVGSVSGGKAGPTTPITLAAFHMTAEADMPGGYDGSPGILTTRGGQVWVTRCLALDDKAPGPMMHCRVGYVRVDDGSLRYAAARPRDTVFESGTLFAADTAPPQLKPLAAPPVGYAVAFTKLKIGPFPFVGYVCTGGGHRLEWPVGDDLGGATADVRFVPHPTKATWISATPPIVHIDANGVTPIGERMHGDSYVVDCAKAIDAPRPLRDGLWMTGQEVHRPDGSLVGAIAGTDALVAP